MRFKLQNAAKDCGLHIIQYIHSEYFSNDIKIDTLRKDSHINQNGLNVSSLIALGREYGIIMEGFQAPLESLLDIKEPMIGVVDNKGAAHFVIFWVKKSKFVILDPAKGKLSLTQEEFKKIYSGFIINFSKGEYVKKQKLDITNPWIYISKNINLIIWILTTIVIAIILSFTSTIYSKIVFDKILPNHLNKTLTLLTIGFVFLALLRTFNDFIKKYLNKKINNIIEIDLSILYIKKLRAGSYFQISKIDKSDHIKRLSLIPSISAFISTSIQVLFNEVLVFTISMGLLIWISTSLFAIAISVAVILAALTILFGFLLNPEYKIAIDNYQKEFQSKSELNNMKIEIKREEKYKKWFYKWQDNFITYKKQEYKIWKLSLVQTTFNKIISVVMPIILTYLSVNMIFNNSISVGSMMMFLGIFHFFIQPSINLADFAAKIKQNIININMLNYVLNIEDETLNEKGFKDKKLNNIFIQELNLTLDKQILDIKNFSLKEDVHIVGANGSGKSMLLKCLAFLIPFKGIVNINNLEECYWSKEYLRNKILYVSSEEFIPTTTVLDFITLNNQSNKEMFNKNDQKYGLTKFLRNNDIAVNSMMISNGNNFSLGQRQIIILMQIFARNFDFLLIDEAFENMSMDNFQYFKQKINALNKTIVEVSHSKRYVKNSKEINIEKLNQNIV